MSKLAYEANERLYSVDECDECPGGYDKRNPKHLKLKTQRLCGYCSMKERIAGMNK